MSNKKKSQPVIIKKIDRFSYFLLLLLLYYYSVGLSLSQVKESKDTRGTLWDTRLKKIQSFHYTPWRFYELISIKSCSINLKEDTFGGWQGLWVAGVVRVQVVKAPGVFA